MPTPSSSSSFLSTLALLIPFLILYSLSLSLSANSTYLCSAALAVLHILSILKARLYTLDVVVCENSRGEEENCLSWAWCTDLFPSTLPRWFRWSGPGTPPCSQSSWFQMLTWCPCLPWSPSTGPISHPWTCSTSQSLHHLPPSISSIDPILCLVDQPSHAYTRRALLHQSGVQHKVHPLKINLVNTNI